VLTSQQARVARQERARAEQQANEAQFQRRRAVQQTAEAEFHRKRAEREAENATRQLAIARRRTLEAELQRGRASRSARAAQEISSAMLQLNPFVAQSPAGLEEGKRAASAALQSLSSLETAGYNDPELRRRRAEFEGIIRNYDQSTAGLNSSVPEAWEFESSAEDEFQAGTDKTTPDDGTTAYIRSKRDTARGSAMLYQIIDAEQYAGRRVQLTARLRTKSVEGRVNLLLAAFETGNVPRGPAVYYALQDPPRATNEWARYEVVADIPPDALYLQIGFSLGGGGGAVWADDFVLEIVHASTPLNYKLPSKTPKDLNFETRN
jgi:hypothetical protein